jgi:predicted aspartyl protease
MHSDALCSIVVALFELYLTLGLMAIGFAFMLAGKEGGARAARFYFAGSLRWVGTHALAIGRGVVFHIAWLMTRMMALLWSALRAHLLRPLMQWLRWASATRRRVTVALAVVMFSGLTIVALAAPAGALTVTLQATGHGMFYAEVVLNGDVRAQALVDTGAIYLSMCGTTAAQLSLSSEKPSS